MPPCLPVVERRRDPVFVNMDLVRELRDADYEGIQTRSACGNMPVFLRRRCMQEPNVRVFYKLVFFQNQV